MKKSVISLMIVIIMTNLAHGQWVKTNLSDASAFIVIGNALYFANNGAYHTIDNGTTFIADTNGLPKCRGCSVPSFDAISGFAFLGNYIFAGTGLSSGSHGVYRMSNNGVSWVLVSTGLPTFTSAYGPAIYNIGHFAVIGNNLFAVVGSNGVYLSTNFGTSWAPKNTGLPVDLHVGDIAAIGNYLFATYYYGTGTGKLYYSSNFGTSWMPLNNGPFGGLNITSLGVNGNVLFAFATDGGVYSSPDNGTSWTSSTLVNAGYPSVNYITCFTASNNKLFAGSAYGGIYLSTDNGASWITVNSGIPTGTLGRPYPIDAIAVKDTFLFAGVSGGTLRRPLSDMVTNKMPYLSFPDSGKTNVTLFPTLRWLKPNEPVSYILQVATNSGFVSPIIDTSKITNTYFPLSNLASNTTYYWRVRSVRATDTSTYSSTWCFTTSSGNSACLLANFNFNGNANDSSGNQYLGPLYGATYTTDRSGAPNSALLFNGTCSDANPGYFINRDLMINNSFTIAAWVNFKGIPGCNYPIITRTNDIQTNDGLADFNLRIQSNNNLNFFMGNGNTNGYGVNISGGTVSANTWFHVAVSFNGDTGKIYFNGLLKQAMKFTGGTRQIGPYIVLVIGRYYQTVADLRTFNGAIDDMRIYGCALPDGEINAIYNGNSTKVGGKGGEVSSVCFCKTHCNATTYFLPKRSHVCIRYFNLEGKQILTLINQTQDQGHYFILPQLKSLATGTLIQVFQAGDFIQREKVILTR